MIIRSVHNNDPRSLTSTADLSPISIPTGTFSTTLHALLGNELDYLCKCKLQSHTICYKMAFDPHPILNCTWDVVTTCIPVTVFFPLSEMRTYQLACCTTAHRVRPQHFWWQQCFLTTLTTVSQSALSELYLALFGLLWYWSSTFPEVHGSWFTASSYSHYGEDNIVR